VNRAGRSGTKKGQAICLTSIGSLLSTVPVHPWSKESSYRLYGLQVASRHLARLVVALEVEADLLAFDDFAHSSALDGRDVNEGVSAAVVRLNEAEAFGGIEPFNCASGHDEPFHSNIDDRHAKALRMMIAIVLKGGFVQGAVLVAQ
jgi:hypothetical protein